MSVDMSMYGRVDVVVVMGLDKGVYVIVNVIMDLIVDVNVSLRLGCV